mgnify:CR=1 FL=1
MALNDTDRHRFIAATVLTLLALPALWWANTSENSSAPNLALAGIDAGVDVGAEPTTSIVEADGAFEAEPPVFLDGPASPAGAGQSAIAVPAPPLIDEITAKATFRSSVTKGTCIVPGLTSGTQVTVVNLDNNRSTTCTTVLSPGNSAGDLVMHTSAFATIADLTDAPISVEIRR